MSIVAEPLLIAHRGASGYRPEHTLASYELAARMGADYLEADVVPTRDGVLVARHEPEIGGTTDVADFPEFAGRRTTKTIDGATVTGWFTQDFTLAELKTLHAVERLPAVRQHNTLYNGRYQIPTVQEYLDLVSRMSLTLNRRIGVYIETKHPTFFRSQGQDVDALLAELIRRNELDQPDTMIFVESFETNLIQLHQSLPHVPMVQLIDVTGGPADQPDASYTDLVTPSGLADIARYAEAIGPDKSLVIGDQPSQLVTEAHRAGLRVHPYTFRNENQFLPTELRGSARANDYGRAIDEYSRFFRLGTDGVFTDNPDTALLARAQLHATSTR